MSGASAAGGSTRALGRRWAWSCIVAKLLLACGCVRSLVPFAGAPPSLSAGEWRGTTSQGMPIAFTVSASELVTQITVGHDFNGCSASETFADLSVRTAPDVTCIPGPCTGALESYRAFGYSRGSAGTGPYTQINGLFLPGNEARGQVGFFDYPVCGTATAVEWTATKQ